MGSGGSQTVNTDPWSKQQPFLQNQYQQGAGLYQGGVGFNPYPGPQFAGLDPLQKQGMGMIQNAATNPNAAGNAAGTALSGILQGKAYQPSYLGGAMAQNQAGVPGIQNAMGQSWMNQPFSQGILGTAQGNFLGSNPYLNDVYNTAARKSGEVFSQQTMPRIQAGAQGAGQASSSRAALAQGQAAGMQGQGLQDLAAQIYAPAYESERNRMMQAGGLGLQGYGQDIGTQLQGAGMLQQGQEANLQRLLSGANLQSQNNQFNTNAQLQAAGLAPSVSNWGAQQLMNLGGINQGMNQQELTGMQNYWNQYNQAPWQRLGAYGQTIMGGGSPGSQQTTDYGGGFSPVGALGGAGTGAAIYGAAGLSQPWLWPLLIGGGMMGGIR